VTDVLSASRPSSISAQMQSAVKVFVALAVPNRVRVVFTIWLARSA
jgi:hypothetical protein